MVQSTRLSLPSQVVIASAFARMGIPASLWMKQPLPPDASEQIRLGHRKAGVAWFGFDPDKATPAESKLLNAVFSRLESNKTEALLDVESSVAAQAGATTMILFVGDHLRQDKKFSEVTYLIAQMKSAIDLGLVLCVVVLNAKKNMLDWKLPDLAGAFVPCGTQGAWAQCFKWVSSITTAKMAGDFRFPFGSMPVFGIQDFAGCTTYVDGELVEIMRHNHAGKVIGVNEDCYEVLKDLFDGNFNFPVERPWTIKGRMLREVPVRRIDWQWGEALMGPGRRMKLYGPFRMAIQAWQSHCYDQLSETYRDKSDDTRLDTLGGGYWNQHDDYVDTGCGFPVLWAGHGPAVWLEGKSLPGESSIRQPKQGTDGGDPTPGEWQSLNRFYEGGPVSESDLEPTEAYTLANESESVRKPNPIFCPHVFCDLLVERYSESWAERNWQRLFDDQNWAAFFSYDKRIEECERTPHPVKGVTSGELFESDTTPGIDATGQYTAIEASTIGSLLSRRCPGEENGTVYITPAVKKSQYVFCDVIGTPEFRDPLTVLNEIEQELKTNGLLSVLPAKAAASLRLKYSEKQLELALVEEAPFTPGELQEEIDRDAYLIAGVQGEAVRKSSEFNGVRDFYDAWARIGSDPALTDDQITVKLDRLERWHTIVGKCQAKAVTASELVSV